MSKNHSPEEIYRRGQQKTAVLSASAKLRHTFETTFAKQSNLRELRRRRIQARENRIVKLIEANKFGNDATEKTITKNLLPKEDIKMLDAFWDTGSQFFKKYVSATVPRATQKLRSISSDWWVKFAKHPRLAFASAALLGGIISFNLIRGSFNYSKNQESEAIPKNYQKGYDLINEYTSDFGSPSKASVVTRSLTPYVSSPRRAIITSTRNIINSNIALSAHKNALGHMRY
jgi:hypothetical protein